MSWKFSSLHPGKYWNLISLLLYLITFSLCCRHEGTSSRCRTSQRFRGTSCITRMSIQRVSIATCHWTCARVECTLNAVCCASMVARTCETIWTNERQVGRCCMPTLKIHAKYSLSYYRGNIQRYTPITVTQTAPFQTIN